LENPRRSSARCGSRAEAQPRLSPP
jgi:hypothetical protein